MTGFNREKVIAFSILLGTLIVNTTVLGNDLCSPSQESATSAAIKAAFPYQGSFDIEAKRITVRVKQSGPKISLTRAEKASLKFLTIADEQGQSCILRSPSFGLEKTSNGCDDVTAWVARYGWDLTACSAVQSPVIFIPGARADLRALPSPALLPITPELIAQSHINPFSPIAMQCPEISNRQMYRWRSDNKREIMEVAADRTGIAADECMHTGLAPLDVFYCRHPLSDHGAVSSAYTLVFDGVRLVYAIFDGSYTGADSYTQFNYDRQNMIAAYNVGETMLFVFRGGYVLYQDGSNWRASYRDTFLYTGAVECGDNDEDTEAPPKRSKGAIKCDEDGLPPGQDTRFKKAYALKEAGKYQEALVLFQKGIAVSPNGCYIDYDIGWAMFCLAQMDQLGEILEYYKIMRTRFPGDRSEGSQGGIRNWDDVLERVRETVAASQQPNAKEVLKQMRELDKSSSKSGKK